MNKITFNLLVMIFSFIVSFSTLAIDRKLSNEEFYSFKGFDFIGSMEKGSKNLEINGRLFLPNECGYEISPQGIYNYAKFGDDISLNGFKYFRNQYFVKEPEGGIFLLRWNDDGRLEGYWNNSLDKWMVEILPIRRKLGDSYYRDAKYAATNFSVSERIVGHDSRILSLQVKDQFDVEIGRSTYCLGTNYDLFDLNYSEDRKEYRLSFRVELDGSDYGDPSFCDIALSKNGKVLNKRGHCPE